MNELVYTAVGILVFVAGFIITDLLMDISKRDDRDD